jgi:hypothetical protein
VEETATSQRKIGDGGFGVRWEILEYVKPQFIWNSILKARVPGRGHSGVSWGADHIKIDEREKRDLLYKFGKGMSD